MTSAAPRTTQDSTVDDWTQGLAEANGSPGGGAASGVMLAMAASLTAMVARYSHPKDGRNADVERITERADEARAAALRLADEDAIASEAFGAAFRVEEPDERAQAIRSASITAAGTSAALGARAAEAISDLEWLAEHGNPALVADIAVAFGALRAAIVGARTNVSFDLGSLTSAGEDLRQVREDQPELWSAVQACDDAIDRIDAATRALDPRAAPTQNVS